MILTNSFEIQGYFITDYLDVIFDEIFVGLGLRTALKTNWDNGFASLSGGEATEMISKLNSIKQTLRERVISKAKTLGANALIGIDFKSSKHDDIIMVSMVATAVKIDKIITPLPLTQAEQKKQEELVQKATEVEKRQQILENIRVHLNDFDKELFLD